MACLDLKLTIDGVDRTSLLLHETLTISQTNDGLNSTCTFDLLDQDVMRGDVWTVEETRVEDGDVITGYLTFFPQTKVIVCITNAAETLIFFAGTLARINATHMGQIEVMPGFAEPEAQVLHCECQDFNQVLEEMVIDDFREYGGIQDEDLIDAVFDEFVFPFGNPINYAAFVTAVPYVFDIITFDSITVRQFMDTICAQSGAVWYVDYSANLHYAADEAALVPAWHLSDVPDDVNSFEYFDDITKEKDATNLVNRVFVVCGTDILPVSLWFIDQASIDKYGSHRAIVRDTSLFDIDDIEAKGTAILEKFKDPIITYVLKTYKGTPGGGATNVIRAGQHIRVVCAFYDLDETFLINSLVVTFPVDGTPVYEVTCGGLDSSASASARRLDLDRINVPNITPSSLPIASRGWGHNMTFSATDDDTVAWEGPGAGDGTITTADGITFTITPANTGNMADVTYIYLDTSLSVTTLQTSVNPEDSIGLGKILIAVCAPDTAAVPTSAMYQVFGGGAGTTVFLHADNVAANCITANEIYGNTLSVVAADMGLLTAGEIRMIGAAGSITLDPTGIKLFDGNDPAADNIRLWLNTANGIFTFASAVAGNPRIEITNTEIAGYDGADVLQFELAAATGRITAINANISGTITIGNPGDIDGSTINNDDGWTDDTAADAAQVDATQAIVDAAAANAHRILGVTGTWARTDADTITWTGVVLRLGDGSDVNILNGNTGNMVAKSYIYYNGTTTLQITANPNVIGGTHTLVAVAQNGATLASIQVVGGATYISGDWINTGTITAALLNVAHLSAITANMGTLTAGTIQTAAAGNDRVVINIADGIRGIDAADVVQFQLDPADGVAKAGAGAVWMDENGLNLEYDTALSKVAWRDGAGNALASLHSELFGPQVGLLLHCDPTSNEGSFISIRAKGGPLFDDSYIFLRAPGTSDASGYVHLNPKGVGADVTLFANGVTAVQVLEGYTKVYNDLRVEEGLYVGSLAVDPDTDDIWVADDIRVGGGLYVGALGVDPDADDVWVAKDVRVAGGVMLGSASLDPPGATLCFSSATYRLRRNVTHIEWFNGSAWIQLD